MDRSSEGLGSALQDARFRAFLREFGYVIAHDLGSPAQKVGAFAGYLADDLGPDLSADAAESLRCLSSSVQELQLRLQALSEWCRLPEIPGPMEPVALGTLLQGVRKERPELAFACNQESELLTCDAPLMGRLLLELLTNAETYAQGAPSPPRVELLRVGSEAQLTVSDAGSGLGSEQRDCAHLPFRRFVGASECQGAGLGLSIAWRVADMHGCSLVLEDAAPGLRVRVAGPL